MCTVFQFFGSSCSSENKHFIPKTHFKTFSFFLQQHISSLLVIIKCLLIPYQLSLTLQWGTYSELEQNITSYFDAINTSQFVYHTRAEHIYEVLLGEELYWPAEASKLTTVLSSCLFSLFCLIRMLRGNTERWFQFIELIYSVQHR